MTMFCAHTHTHRGEVLEKVIEYLHFKTKYGAAADVDIPDFKNRIPPEIALEL